MLMSTSKSEPVASKAGGWRRERERPSLAEVFGSVATRPTGSFWRKLLSFLGPGYLVAVGYMDPGNWATSLAGGSKFGYALLTVALLSNLMAILLQALSDRFAEAMAEMLHERVRREFWGYAPEEGFSAEELIAEPYRGIRPAPAMSIS